MTSCGADILSNQLSGTLLDGQTFAIPNVNLGDAKYLEPAVSGVPDLDNADLTTRAVGGTGAFDNLMAGVAAHLKAEFEASRITGAEYTKAYIELTGTAISGAIQFLLQKDLVRLQAQTAEIALVAARVQLATAKAQLAAQTYEARNQEAAYALAKLKLAGEDIAYCTAKYNLEQLLPAQLSKMTKENQLADKQIELATNQIKLILEQAESQHAQTSNTKIDGVTPVTGVLGKQRELYDQQITSYKRDAEVKVAKIFSDAWITQKTMDEGTLPPTNFNNASLDTILAALKTNAGLG